MANLFSDDWMKQFGKAWNADEDMVKELSKIDFESNIAYGFIGEDGPRGVLVVKSGRVYHAGAYAQEPLNWDLRATPENWLQWMQDGFGLARLGVTVASGKLKFAVGDYRKMVRTPSMAAPFLRSFELMSKLKTEV
jgi:hypothetical protein